MVAARRSPSAAVSAPIASPSAAAPAPALRVPSEPATESCEVAVRSSACATRMCRTSSTRPPSALRALAWAAAESCVSQAARSSASRTCGLPSRVSALKLIMFLSASSPLVGMRAAAAETAATSARTSACVRAREAKARIRGINDGGPQCPRGSAGESSASRQCVCACAERARSVPERARRVPSPAPAPARVDEVRMPEVLGMAAAVAPPAANICAVATPKPASARAAARRGCGRESCNSSRATSAMLRASASACPPATGPCADACACP
mmetsp:Transcript_9359/g.23685  ORF Transcript_9359/g.23685 Transcript_9359/m.23685 type:complete len:269 (-) Transcript_9359:323-1129(-)